MNNFKQYLNRKKIEYGDKFDPSTLSEQFIPYYENGKRIEVEFTYGEEKELKRGTIGITTGWRPVFMLMLKSNSRSSSHLLDDSVKIIKVIG